MQLVPYNHFTFPDSVNARAFEPDTARVVLAFGTPAGGTRPVWMESLRLLTGEWLAPGMGVPMRGVTHWMELPPPPHA